MNLIVNGEKYEHCGDGTVPALLAELGAEPGHTALTVNGDLVFSKDWNSTACEFPNIGKTHSRAAKLARRMFIVSSSPWLFWAPPCR